jgi:hypothetical protein
VKLPDEHREREPESTNTPASLNVTTTVDNRQSPSVSQPKVIPSPPGTLTIKDLLPESGVPHQVELLPITTIRLVGAVGSRQVAFDVDEGPANVIPPVLRRLTG